MPASEAEILAIIDRHFPKTSQKFAHGRGDDCAVLRSMGDIAISTDLFLEDAHFRQAYFTPEEIGWKALAVNISDLAAAGATPCAFSLGLALPRGLTNSWLDSFFKGMASLASEHGLDLSGGDLSQAAKICVCITILGKAPENGGLERKVSRPGDAVFIVGQLGLATLGLEQLEKTGREPAMKNWPDASLAHLVPRPQVRAGQILARLAQSGQRIGLLDVSDGLAMDLPRLLADGQGAELFVDSRHIPRELLRACGFNEATAIERMLAGGEDYALAGTCPESAFALLQKAIPECWRAGTVTDSGQFFCHGKPLHGGFDHFK